MASFQVAVIVKVVIAEVLVEVVRVANCNSLRRNSLSSSS